MYKNRILLKNNKNNMTTIEVKNKSIEESLKKSWNISFEWLKNIILKNFLKTQMNSSLIEENYSKEDIDSFAQDYLDSFEEKNLTNI